MRTAEHFVESSKNRAGVTLGAHTSRQVPEAAFPKNTQGKILSMPSGGRVTRRWNPIRSRPFCDMEALIEWLMRDCRVNVELCDGVVLSIIGVKCVNMVVNSDVPSVTTLWWLWHYSLKVQRPYSGQVCRHPTGGLGAEVHSLLVPWFRGSSWKGARG